MADDTDTLEQPQSDYSAAYSDYSLGPRRAIGTGQLKSDYQTRDEQTGELQPGYKHVDQNALFDAVAHGGIAEQQLKQSPPPVLGNDPNNVNNDKLVQAQIHHLTLMGMAAKGREAEEHLLRMDEAGDLDGEHSWKVDLIKQRRQEEADQQVVADMRAGKRIIASPEDVRRLQANANARAKFRSSQYLDDDQRKTLIEETFKNDAEIRRASTPVPPEVTGASPATKQKAAYGQFSPAVQKMLQDHAVQMDPKTGMLTGIRNFKPPEPSEQQQPPPPLGVPGEQNQPGQPHIIGSSQDWQRLPPGSVWQTTDGRKGFKAGSRSQNQIYAKYGPELYEQMKNVPHKWEHNKGSGWSLEVDEKAASVLQQQKMNQFRMETEKFKVQHEARIAQQAQDTAARADQRLADSEKEKPLTKRQKDQELTHWQDKWESHREHLQKVELPGTAATNMLSTHYTSEQIDKEMKEWEKRNPKPTFGEQQAAPSPIAQAAPQKKRIVSPNGKLYYDEEKGNWLPIAQ